MPDLQVIRLISGTPDLSQSESLGVQAQLGPTWSLLLITDSGIYIEVRFFYIFMNFWVVVSVWTLRNTI